MSLKRMTMTVIASLLAVGCGYTIRANTDYDRSVNFSTYKTFYMMKGNSSGNPLLDQRATEDVKAGLISKGWTEAPEGQAEAAVVTHATTMTKHTYETLYDGFGGGWGWRRGWGGRFGGSTTYVRDYKVGTVVVDIFDTKTKEAIWRGSASDALSGNPDNNAKATEAAITKMLANFPPGAQRASR
jgi:hypothetical protein